MTEDANITYWCARGNPPKLHTRCTGTWTNSDESTGACLCRGCGHTTFAVDQVEALMESGHDYCPRCRSEWDEHDFTDDTVACPGRA